MIFDALYESALRGELLLVEGGFCHWHLRRDGQLTIREIISTRRGAGSEMLAYLLCVANARCIVAKCPVDLDANDWYARRGFILVNREVTASGRGLNVWRLPCLSIAAGIAVDSQISLSQQGSRTDAAVTTDPANQSNLLT